MKKIIKRILIALISIVLFFAAVVVITDKVIMPEVVDRPEVVVPDLVGMHKDEAIKKLEELDLIPVLEGPRYNNKFPKDHVIFQKPLKNTTVKVKRRIYLAISGGDPLVKVPDLEYKTLRDAQVTIERLGLEVGKITEVRSEAKAGMVVGQNPQPGLNVEKGSVVDLKVSVGPNVGKVRVPDLMGKTLNEAERELRNNSLFLGKVNYQESPNLLPNTVIAQYPSKGTLVEIGETVDVFVTKSSK